jgi:hypothetical protein
MELYKKEIIMKPKNFPGRKNKRRIAALERIKDGHDQEIVRLYQRIVGDSEARLLKTKKFRG